MTAGRATSTDDGSARWIEALNQQAAEIMAVFARAGFEPIAPDIIQPADVFLDLIGEELRGRTYVFSDPDGAELCLRPDLTVPAARIYQARNGMTGATARYCYNGVIFRYQELGADIARPREFRQAGLESFADADPARAEAEVVALTLEAIRTAGLRAFRLHVGDIGLMHALLAAVDMPERWRAQLRHQFWRPEAFRRCLARLSGPRHGAEHVPQDLLARLPSGRPKDAEAIVARHLDQHGLTVAGTRSVREIAAHLLELAEDAHAPALPGRIVDLFEAYLSIRAPASAATERVRALSARHGIDITAALSAFDARLALVAAQGVDVANAEFSAGFGRTFEYYSGFVFEVLAPALAEATPIGGGGRYDRLVEAMGATRPVPAVGAAIHTERLLLAVRGGRP